MPVSPDGTLRPYTAEEIESWRLQTADVKDGSHPTIRLEPTGASVIRTWSCRWSKWEDVRTHFLGEAGIIGSGTNITLTRLMPQAAFPGLQWTQYRAMACENITGAGSAGIDDANGVPAYRRALLQVRYEHCFMKFADDGGPEYDRYVETLPSTTDTQYLNLPGSCLRYVRQDETGEPHLRPIPYNVGRPESTSKVGFKWWRVPRTAWQTGLPLWRRIKGDPSTGERTRIGTVNKDTFMGRPPGTLQFSGVDEDVVPDLVSGQSCFNLTYWFLEKNTGWNEFFWAGNPALGANDLSGYFLANKGGAWQAAGSRTAGRYLFDETNFADLFEIGNV